MTKYKEEKKSNFLVELSNMMVRYRETIDLIKDSQISSLNCLSNMNQIILLFNKANKKIHSKIKDLRMNLENLNKELNYTS